MSYRLRHVCAVVLFAGVSWAQALPAQEDEPFRARNLTPVVAIFGLPSWQPATVGHRFGITSELANDYRLSSKGGDVLILDGETWRTSLQFSGRLTERWSYGIEVPYYRQSGGFLDNLIDAWHGVFGLPDGGRNDRPQDALLFRLADARGSFFNLDQTRQGLGDIQLSAARRVGVEGRYALRVTWKLPTGAEDMLAGSGSSDVALTLMRSQRTLFRARPAGFFWGVGALAAGDAKLIRFRQRHVVLLGILGGSWKPWTRTGLKVQLNFNSAFYDTPLIELGVVATQVTFGAWRQIGRRGTLDLAFNEDLRVSTAPDFGLHFGVRWVW